MIELNGVNFGYGAAADGILKNLSVTFPAGRFTALLGPNGAGKSTLLNLCGGELAPRSGSVFLGGRNMRSWRPRELARRRAFLPQDSQLDFPFSVEEVVMLGRAPHIEKGEREEDALIVRNALDLTGMGAFAGRDYTNLSGGERQRVQLARVLAQAWARKGVALLLDEPVSSLDPAHRHRTLELARDWAHDGACVVAILHDVNLVLAYADDAVLLSGGRLEAAGPVEKVVTTENVARVFDVSARMCDCGDGAPFIVTRGRKS